MMTAIMIVNRRFFSFSQQQKRQVIIMSDFRWNVQDVNFFDSYYEDKTIFINDSIFYFDKNTFFKNIHLFVSRVKNIVVVKNFKLIRKNFWTCLRDRVLKWWQLVLIDEQKRLVKFEKNVDEWVIALKKRFKKSSSNVLNIIITFKYIFENVRRCRNSIDYVFVFFKAVKIINVSIYNQLYFIYNDLKLEFRRDLTRSISDIIMNQFLKQIKNNKKIWWNIVASRSRSHVSFDYFINRSVNISSFRLSDQQDSYNFDYRFNNFSNNSEDYSSKNYDFGFEYSVVDS